MFCGNHVFQLSSAGKKSNNLIVLEQKLSGRTLIWDESALLQLEIGRVPTIKRTRNSSTQFPTIETDLFQKVIFTAMGVKEMVDQKIAGKRVMVFSKSYCPYCKMAKDVLNKYKVEKEVLEIDGRDDCEAIQDYLGKLTGGKTVPRVFIDGKFVGGGSEMKAMDGNGKLAELLK